MADDPDIFIPRAYGTFWVLLLPLSADRRRCFDSARSFLGILKTMGRSIWAISIGIIISALAIQPVLAVTSAPKLVAVKGFKIHGNTIFRDWELANVTQPYTDQELSLDDLQKAADAITRYYLDNGYMTSRAILGDQTIDAGIVQIQVIEGHLENIEIEGHKKVDTSYIKARLGRIQRHPLNQESLENSLRLLKADPLFSNIEAALREGKGLGGSLLNLRLVEANPRIATISIDNHNSPAVGAIVMDVMGSTRNLSGFGDSLTVNYGRSLTGGTQRGNFAYQHPLNGMNGTLALRVSPNQFRLTQADLQEFNINGRSDLYEVGLRQPIVNQPNEQIALGLSLVHRTGVTIIADSLSSASHSTTLRFGQDLLKRDYTGMWTGSSSLNLGVSGNQDSEQALIDESTDSKFLTWTGQLQRLQFIGKNYAIATALNWQIAANTLPAAQKFSLGGATSLRGYPVGFFSADSGVSLAIEPQIVIKRNATGQSIVKVSPFIDLGTVWNHDRETSRVKTGNLFGSAGLGVTWQPTKQWSWQVDIAMPLRSVKSNGSVSPTFYFTSNYAF
jgi:hemolysin activation/secretion protein